MSVRASVLFAAVFLGCTLFFLDDRDAPPLATAARREAPVAESPASPAVRDESVDGVPEEPPTARVAAAATRRISGRVVIPAGTPFDDRLRVTATGGGETVEAPVTAGGSFDVAVAVDASAGGELGLRGRFLYLERTVPYDDSDRAYTLKPKLGARLVVEVRVPADLGSDGDLRAATGIELTSRSSRGAPERRTGVDATWTAAVDALPADRDWHVHVSHPRLYDDRQGPLQLAPGETLRLPAELIRGARLAGRVRHPDGRVAAGVEVTARAISDTGLFALDSSTVVSDEEGRFQLEGQRPGLHALLAAAEGTAGARVDVGRVGDGEERAGIELVLGEGDTVAGSVRWPDGTPAADAVVHVGSQYRTGGRGVELAVDADGRFEGVALSGPPYRVRAEAETEGGGGRWRALVDGVTPDSVGVELVLQPGNRLGGRVVDDTGRPVQRFRISAKQVAAGNASGLEQVRETFEDEQGRFVLEDLPAGDWSLEASASRHGDSAPLRVSLPAMAGAELELMVPREAGVSGRVAGPEGSPEAGGSVRALSARGSKTTKVDAEGRYELGRLLPGAYRLSARGVDSVWGGAREVRLDPGEAREGVDLSSARAGRIAGSLHPSVADREGRRVNLANLTYTFDANATADAEGRFSFDGLPPDEYRVYLDFSSRGGLNREWAEKYAARAEEVVELAEGAQREVVLGAPRVDEVVVLGRLTVAGRPLANQLVYVYPGPEGMSFPVTAGYAAEDGRFQVRLPAAGDYAFTCAPGAERAFGRRIDVPDDSPFELAIELGAGSVSGVVRGADGEPRPAHTLLLRRASAHPDSRRPGDVRTTKTGPDGAFRFADVEDGRWELRSGGLYNDHRTRSEAIEIRSDIVVADGGEVADVELRLRPGCVLTGRCSLADGGVATGARIHVVYADGSRMLPLVGEHVDWSGRFHVPAVAPGVVDVFAELDGRLTPGVSVELAEGAGGHVELVFE